MDGILNIHKEAGYTSHDVVARLRSICGQKKIGHTGTLDPDATGVLPICLGKATKACEYLTDHDKTYKATVLLGITTDTQDMSGKIIRKRQVDVSDDELRKIIHRFVGEIEQIPPMYSAVKIQGKKLYEFARKGIEVERKPRKVTITHIHSISPITSANEFQMTVQCSKGTYIRTLCHDIGEMLGCGAAMKSLIRTRVGIFTLENAKTLEETEKYKNEGILETALISVEDIYGALKSGKVVKEADKLLVNGNPLRENHVVCENEIDDCELIKMYSSANEFVAVYRYQQELGEYRANKIFSS
ncbi:MAG: tRNA pseudouridine(55) synthase TruB [Lachnoclostridium sp.]|jgi:tRNA pseudouridine55 synthase|nr:tRNA pseudouridine(55) synthase TruB [Lachnoclostridium sp.]